MTQVLASGFAMGCIYALVGLGFILIYNATHGLNFAHGEFVMLSSYVFYSAFTADLSIWVAAGVALVFMAAFGALYYLLLFHPLRKRPFVAFIIATIGFSIVLRNLALLVWGPNPLKVPSFLAMSTVRIGDIALTPENLFIIAATFVALVAQYVLFFGTDLGRRIRATAQNPEMAELLGIRLNRMIVITFMVSTLLSGVAGVLIAPIFLLDPDMGGGLILKAFIGVIVGGFGSIPGAVVGGLLVGVMEILIAIFVSSTFKDAIVFGLLILLLLTFPRGIFGGPVEDRV
jgi:branched-chain amino acid transport system permease protein